jgi:hypothetical protein
MLLTENPLTPHRASRGISLCDVLRPSLIPVRTLIVNGTSPKARDIPIKIFPSLLWLSSTIRKRYFSTTQHATPIQLTRRSSTALEHHINRTPAINVHKVDLSTFSSALSEFAGQNLGGAYELGDLGACDLGKQGRVSCLRFLEGECTCLDAEYFFAWVSSDEAPFRV